MTVVGGAAGNAPTCPRCNTSVLYYQDRRYDTYWYKCARCPWSGSGFAILAALWDVGIEEIESRLAARGEYIPFAANEIKRALLWEELERWIVAMVKAPEPEEEIKANVLKTYLKDLRRSDWDSWKAGAGRFVFVTRASELPSFRWTGLESFGKEEYFLAAPIVDYLERPIGLWAKSIKEAFLFPDQIDTEHRTGFVLLQECPKSPVYLANRVLETLEHHLAKSRRSGVFEPFVPCVWSDGAKPESEPHPGSVEPKVLGRLEDLRSMMLILNKKITTFLSLDKSVNLTRVYDRNSFHVMGWEEAIVSGAKRQGPLVRNWAAQIGLAGTEQTAPYAFIRKHDEAIFQELSQGNLFVATYGDRQIWARNGSMYTRDKKNQTVMLLNCVAKINSIFKIGVGAVAECEATIEGRRIQFDISLRELADRRFHDRLAKECLSQAHVGMYCREGGWKDKLGRIILSTHKPVEGADRRPIWGWHGAAASFRLGRVLISQRGNVSTYKHNAKHSPNLDTFKCDEKWLQLCGRKNPLNELMWASAALIASVIVSKMKHHKTADHFGFVTDNRNNAILLALSVLGLNRPEDGIPLDGWPGFVRGHSKTNPRIRVVAADKFMRSQVNGRSWWAVRVDNPMIAPTDLRDAARRILPGWVYYFTTKIRRMKSSTLAKGFPVAVLHTMADWFRELGGAAEVIESSAKLIQCCEGSMSSIRHKGAVNWMEMLLTKGIIKVTNDKPGRDVETPCLWERDGTIVMLRRQFIDLFRWESMDPKGFRMIAKMRRMKVLDDAIQNDGELVFNKLFAAEVLAQSSRSSFSQFGSSGSTSSISLCEGSLGVMSGTPSLMGQEPVECQSAQQA